jgi:hypothetical protein
MKLPLSENEIGKRFQKLSSKTFQNFLFVEVVERFENFLKKFIFENF